jgi:hypothetical protein
MAKSNVDHKARARDAWPALVKRAEARGKPFTYGELCEPLGLFHRVAQYFLKEIQQHCCENGLPPLHALAVTKKTRLPGHGYGCGKVPANSITHKQDCERVYAAKWPMQAPF